jgi:hypothetical protein
MSRQPSWWCLAAVSLAWLALNADPRAAEEAKSAGGADPSTAKAPENREAREALIDKLIAEYRNPPEPAVPTAAEQAGIDKVLAGFAAEGFEAREAASAAAAKLGPVALGAMRRAAGSQDLEVAERARKAAADIERAMREALVGRIEAVPGSAEILEAKVKECDLAWGNLAMAVPAAERNGKEAEVAKLRAEMARFDELRAMLKAIRAKSETSEPAAAVGATTTIIFK